MSTSRAPAARIPADNVDTEPVALADEPSDSAFDQVEKKAKAFVKEHYGNPESGEVYGVGNDYESEEDQIVDEKASGAQAIWIIGAMFILTAIGYWVLN